MTQALVAVFENQADAQKAREALLSEGFLRNSVQLASTESMDDTSPSGEIHQHTDGTDRRNESLGQKIGNMLGFGKEDDTRTYTEAVRRGNCVLTVDVNNDEEARRAERIMEQQGPVDIDERAARWRAESTDTAQSTGATRSTGEEEVIPIVEEEERVGKREASRGGVRVRSHNYEVPVEEDVNLHEQHTEVSRRPADRPASEADMAYGEVNREFRDTAEEPVTSKEARVTEEVVVGRESSDRTEKVRDDVRRTDVDVEKLDEEETNSGNERKTR